MTFVSSTFYLAENSFQRLSSDGWFGLYWSFWPLCSSINQNLYSTPSRFLLRGALDKIWQEQIKFSYLLCAQALVLVGWLLFLSQECFGIVILKGCYLNSINRMVEMYCSLTFIYDIFACISHRANGVGRHQNRKCHKVYISRKLINIWQWLQQGNRKKDRKGNRRNLLSEFKNIWKSKSISIKAMRDIMITYVISVVLCVCETWMLKKKDKNKLMAFEMRCC